MQQSTNANRSYLDIIYDGRNKAYGGYELRSHYPQRMRNALFYTLIAIALPAIIAIFSGFKTADKIREHYNPVAPTDVILPPVKPPLTPPPAPVPPIKPEINTKRFTSFNINKDHDVDDNQKPVEVKDLKNANAGAKTSLGDSTDIDPGLIPHTGVLGGVGVIPTKPSKPLIYVEQPPDPGYDLNAYLQNNLHYPEQAKAANIQGRVIIRFVVNEDGSISNAELIHGIGNGCDEESIRVIAAMPKWKPGKQAGIPVKVYFNQPVSFKLE